MTLTAYKAKISEKAIDVVEAGRRPRKGRIAFDLGRDLEFSTDALRSYAFASWEPVIYDAMVLAAAVDDRLFFAGEACSKHDYSTAHGAYRTGIAAAEQAMTARKSRS